MGRLTNNEVYSKAPRNLDVSKIPTTHSPFGYYGAKQRIATKIVSDLPPHNAWVEAFCGSAAITMAKKPAPIEVINDLDGQIVNVFRQLRKNPKELCEAIALTPYARVEFQKARRARPAKSRLERARQFLVATMMTINGTAGGSGCGFSFSQSYARDGKEARVNRWYHLPERLEKVVERLKHIRIENRDARKLVEMFEDRPATLIYLDPPYFVRRQHGYKVDARDEKFHKDLLKICCKARCMLLISGYGNPLYDSILTRDNGWSRTTIETHTRDTSGKDFSRTEVLWKNIYYQHANKLGRVPIRLTKKEKDQNKINPSR